MVAGLAVALTLLTAICFAALTVLPSQTEAGTLSWRWLLVGLVFIIAAATDLLVLLAIGINYLVAQAENGIDHIEG